jgi:hypothetical protein
VVNPDLLSVYQEYSARIVAVRDAEYQASAEVDQLSGTSELRPQLQLPELGGVMQTLLRVTVLILSLLAAPSMSQAQDNTERTDPQLRARCENAGRVVTTSASDIERAAAYRRLESCDETRPAALAEIWAQPPMQRSELSLLANGSRGIQDERVVSAAEAVALRSTAPADVRVAAMMYLASLLNSSLHYRIEDLVALTQPRHLQGVPVMQLSHDRQYDPAGEPLRSRIVQVLASIARSDPSIQMRHAAEELLTTAN